MASKKRGINITTKVINKYWVDRANTDLELCNLVGDLSFEVITEDKGCSCYACGKPTKSLQRCHIVPHSLGGNDDPSNMFLMCGECHRNNPDTSYPDMFFHYVKNVEFYMVSPVHTLFKQLNLLYTQSSEENRNIFDNYVETTSTRGMIDMYKDMLKESTCPGEGYSNATRSTLIWKGALSSIVVTE